MSDAPSTAPTPSPAPPPATSPETPLPSSSTAMALAMTTARRLLLLVAGALLCARTCAVDGPLSGNDRSRWATVRALVEEHTYVIGWRLADGRPPRDVGIVTEPGWHSEDVLLHPDTGAFLSSKPPLLATVAAALTWVLDRALSISLVEQRGTVVRVVLFTLGVAPLLWALARLTRRLAAPTRPADSALLLVAAATFGTFMTTFATTLQGHVLAAAAVIIAIDAVLRILCDPHGTTTWRFIVAGAAAGVAAALELPALGFAGAVAVLLARRDLPRTLALFAPALALPLLALLATSALATGDPLLYVSAKSTSWMQFPGSYWEAPSGVDVRERSLLRYAFHFLIGHHGAFSLTPIFLLAPLGMARSILPGEVVGRSAALRPATLAVVGVVLVPLACAALRKGLGAPAAVSLVPAVVAALAALLLPWRANQRPLHEVVVARIAFASTVMCLAFYLAFSWNYGGITSGPRWLLWLAPLWLLAAAPVVDDIAASARGRWLLLLLIAVSAFSSLSPGTNPWRHPWLYSLLT